MPVQQSTFCGAASQPLTFLGTSEQFASKRRGTPGRVKKQVEYDRIVLDAEVQFVRKAPEQNPTEVAGDWPEEQWLPSSSCCRRAESFPEVAPEASGAAVVPSARFYEIVRDLWAEK